jgi:2-polyprenyl-3-methyl-5-hydroxy-6-metoxy-1,4-benzoquinol methylase
MSSIGHRTGLFDAMTGLPPSTSDEIAARAGLAERYVREWLAVMVTGRIVAYDADARTYQLPAAHAAILTRRAPLGNFAVAAQFVPLMGAVQERIVDCFRTGGGTAYEHYPCFHQVMAEDSGQTVVDQLFDTLLPLAPGLVERLERGSDVLDAGCGRGLALLAMAERFPQSRFLGIDLCPDAIAAATADASAKGLDNVRFEASDLTGFDAVEAFDLVTSFDAVHDQKDPEGLIRALFRSLRPGGLYFMQDIAGSARLENNVDFALAPLLYAVSTVHCTPVSLGQGGPGLGTMWGWETAQAMLEGSGFAEVTKHVLPHDPMNVWFVARKA